MQPTAAARPRLIWGCDASGVVDRDATCIVDRPGRRTTMTRGPGFPGPNAAYGRCAAAADLEQPERSLEFLSRERLTSGSDVADRRYEVAADQGLSRFMPGSGV